MSAMYTDQQMLAASLRTMLEFFQRDSGGGLLYTDDSASYQVEQAGPDWMVIEAVRWLAGKTAQDTIEAMEEGSCAGGVEKENALLFVKVAADMCAVLEDGPRSEPG